MVITVLVFTTLAITALVTLYFISEKCDLALIRKY